MNQKRYDWPVTLFLFGVLFVALVGTPIYVYFSGWHWPLWAFALIFAVLTEISITAGYHRLFAHRSFEAHPLARLALILVGSSAWQGSVLRWTSGHRTHHKYIDQHLDPYNINQGFWHAHMGWMLLKDSKSDDSIIGDLKKDKLILFQDKYYVAFAIAMGFGFPWLVGFLMDAPLGGLLIAGFLRIALTQQLTYFVNSLAHMIGDRPYSQEVTARDSLWIAILTQGEGYHNYHHRFEADYRNGIRWFNWDPTKWLIWSMSKVGLAKRLRRISNEEILKAKLHVEALRLKSKGFSEEKLEQLRERIISTSLKLKKLRAEAMTASRDRMDFIRLEIELTKHEFRYALKQWKICLRSPVALSQ